MSLFNREFILMIVIILFHGCGNFSKPDELSKKKLTVPIGSKIESSMKNSSFSEQIMPAEESTSPANDGEIEILKSEIEKIHESGLPDKFTFVPCTLPKCQMFTLDSDDFPSMSLFREAFLSTCEGGSNLISDISNGIETIGMSPKELAEFQIRTKITKEFIKFECIPRQYDEEDDEEDEFPQTEEI